MFFLAYIFTCWLKLEEDKNVYMFYFDQNGSYLDYMTYSDRLDGTAFYLI